MNTTVIKIYYVLLFVMTIGMASRTVMTGSKYVSYGQKIAELEQQKQSYLDQQLKLQQNLSSEQSLAMLSSSAQQEGYSFIQNVIQVQNGGIVASR